LDFTDRAAFFRPDRLEDFNEETDHEDDYYFRPHDPFLPAQLLYDPSNALLYCDGCDRLYHQKCHFCPVTVVPRGAWQCLLCHYFQDDPDASSSKPQKLAKRRKLAGTGEPKKGHAKSATDPALYRQMRQAFTSNQLFVSPPVAAVRPLEVQWEYESCQLKASHFHTQVLTRLQRSVVAQASAYRLAETAVVTLTSTSKNRNHFFKNKQRQASQELAQTLVRFYGIRKQWRQACGMLHDLQRGHDTRWDGLIQFAQNSPPDFVTRVLFPFGMEHARRVEPRTAEAKKAHDKTSATSAPPQEIVVPAQKMSKKAAAAPRKEACAKKSSKTTEDDEDSGISLDDLQCCVCRTSEATDENDLVLCDGEGCFRAYHAHCLQPALKESDLDEDVDWCCPLCCALADNLLVIQTVHLGDEWEQARYAAMIDNDKGDLDSSMQSWAHVDQVFPTAEEDYAAACQMKEGKRNKATDDLLARVLGLDAMPDHDDDDEVEDGNFDLGSYQKEREDLHKKPTSGESEEESDAADDDDDGSSRSSQATLVEMSSVELEVGKAELDALSKGSSDEDESDDDGGGGLRRRSRRLRKSVEDSSSNDLVESDMGRFDEANILEGKRGRKPVDYIQLNAAIFGDAPDEGLDDTNEFRQTTRTKEASDSSDSGEEGDSDGSSGVESESDSKTSGGDTEENGETNDGASEGSDEVQENGKRKRPNTLNGTDMEQETKPRPKGTKTTKGRGQPNAPTSRTTRGGKKTTASKINGSKSKGAKKR
jgi:hypothetical protein